MLQAAGTSHAGSARGPRRTLLHTVALKPQFRAEAASSSSPRPDSAALPIIMHVDIGKQLAFPDSPSRNPDRIAAAATAHPSGHPPPHSSPASESHTPSAAPSAAHSATPSPRAAAQEPAAPHANVGGEQPPRSHEGDDRPSPARRMRKASRARPWHLCACGLAGAAGPEAEASPRTVETEITFARQRFERLTTAAMPAVVVQPDAGLCLCELDRAAFVSDGAATDEADHPRASGGPEHGRAASDSSTDDDPRDRVQAGGPPENRPDGSVVVDMDAPDESAIFRVADASSEDSANAPDGTAGRDDREARGAPHSAVAGAAEAAGDSDVGTCFCYRIDLAAQDFEHTRHA